MQLTRAQLEAFDRDGFLVFPELLAQEEIDILLSETERVSRVEADGIFREGDDQQAKRPLSYTHLTLPPILLV